MNIWQQITAAPVHAHTPSPTFTYTVPSPILSIQPQCSLDTTGSSPSVELSRTLWLKFQNLGSLICYLFIQWACPGFLMTGEPVDWNC